MTTYIILLPNNILNKCNYIHPVLISYNYWKTVLENPLVSRSGYHGHHELGRGTDWSRSVALLPDTASERNSLLVQWTFKRDVKNSCSSKRSGRCEHTCTLFLQISIIFHKPKSLTLQHIFLQEKCDTGFQNSCCT